MLRLDDTMGLVQEYLKGGISRVLCTNEIHLLLVTLSACENPREVADVISACPPLLYALNKVATITLYEGKTVLGLYQIVNSLGVDYITTFTEGLFDTAVNFEWTDQLWSERERASKEAQFVSKMTAQMVHYALDRDIARTIGSFSKLGSYVAITLMSMGQLSVDPTTMLEDIDAINYMVAQSEFGMDIHTGYRFRPLDHQYIGYDKACAFAHALTTSARHTART